PTSPLRLLSRDPFPDVGRAVPEFDSVYFADHQEFHDVAVDEKDVPEIDRYGAALPCEHLPKDVQVFRCNPATYEQDHQTFVSHLSVDPAAHRDVALVLRVTRPRHRSVRPASPTLKYEARAGGRDTCRTARLGSLRRLSEATCVQLPRSARRC